jgi:prepilin-type N-terminal cleavage/methylation domain-containing protein
VKRVLHGVCGPERTNDERDGFGLIEVLIAITLFTVVSVFFVSSMLSSLTAYSLSKRRTLAEQTATKQLEEIRQLGYDSVGIVNGNPPGTVAATRTVTIGGSPFTVATQIEYVNDPLPNGYTTAANYKRVSVQVSNSAKTLASLETLVAPPTAPGLTKSVIVATVSDSETNAIVSGARVDLQTGPSAPRADVTPGTDGTVTFAGLTPNPTTGLTAYYDLAVTPPTGYELLPEDKTPNPPAHKQVAPGEFFRTSLRVYKPCTITVNLVDAAGLPFTATSTVTINSSSRGTQTFTVTGGTLALTDFNGVKIVPGPYTVAATASPDFVGRSVQQNVPNVYPTDLSKTFTIVMTSTPSRARLNVTTKSATGNITLANTRVNISGGPSGIFFTAVTNSSGLAVFDVPVGVGDYTVSVPAQGNYASISVTKQATAVTAQTFTISVPTAGA